VINRASGHSESLKGDKLVFAVHGDKAKGCKAELHITSMYRQIKRFRVFLKMQWGYHMTKYLEAVYVTNKKDGELLCWSYP